jgi:hypothetical protein
MKLSLSCICLSWLLQRCNTMPATIYLSPSAQLVSSAVPFYSLGVCQCAKCDPRVVVASYQDLQCGCVLACVSRRAQQLRCLRRRSAVWERYFIPAALRITRHESSGTNLLSLCHTAKGDRQWAKMSVYLQYRVALMGSVSMPGARFA